MKHVSLCIGALLLALMSPVLAQTSPLRTATATPAANEKAKTTTTVVQPGEKKGGEHVKVTNGNYGEVNPQYAGSNGKIRIKDHDGSTEVKCDGSVKGKIEGIKSGDTVTVSTNSTPVDISGNGGSISVGSGSTVCITNTGGAGAGNMTATTPGGSTISIPPGSTCTITG